MNQRQQKKKWKKCHENKKNIRLVLKEKQLGEEGRDVLEKEGGTGNPQAGSEKKVACAGTAAFTARRQVIDRKTICYSTRKRRMGQYGESKGTWHYGPEGAPGVDICSAKPGQIVLRRKWHEGGVKEGPWGGGVVRGRGSDLTHERVVEEGKTDTH